MEEIITGEKIQQICNIYVGKIEDFKYNPIIKSDVSKLVNIDLINKDIRNPYYIFFYGHLINEL